MTMSRIVSRDFSFLSDVPDNVNTIRVPRMSQVGVADFDKSLQPYGRMPHDECVRYNDGEKLASRHELTIGDTTFDLTNCDLTSDLTSDLLANPMPLFLFTVTKS